ncbi:uncharacterized protein [Miscanthus floridulus]|uniref:uncharacterized protein n=1 Tax=Miscanthus floridulus TaxID=154761 RepID=UPI0034577897
MRHALEDCTMLWHYYTKLELPDDDAKKRGADDRDDDKDEGFPEVYNAFMIFGGPLACLTVLMDGGSGLNILYANTLELLELDRSRLRGDTTPFNGIIPRKRTRPLGCIDLPVCFDTPSNYHKEVLIFEEVGFRGTYHAILGRLCHAKFMAVPNYTYLKLKMPGPNGVITIECTYEHAYDWDVECIEYAEALVEAETLIIDLDQLSSQLPKPKHQARTFEPAEAVKLVPVDPAYPDDRALRISATLDIK